MSKFLPVSVDTTGLRIEDALCHFVFPWQQPPTNVIGRTAVLLCGTNQRYVRWAAGPVTCLECIARAQ